MKTVGVWKVSPAGFLPSCLKQNIKKHGYVTDLWKSETSMFDKRVPETALSNKQQMRILWATKRRDGSAEWEQDFAIRNDVQNIKGAPQVKNPNNRTRYRCPKDTNIMFIIIGKMITFKNIIILMLTTSLKIFRTITFYSKTVHPTAKNVRKTFLAKQM